MPAPLEVLAANGVEVMIDADNGYTPTPVISHAILSYNRGRKRGLADGIVITPSHNPPRFGGFKYDPPHGGPADTHVTRWIEQTGQRLHCATACAAWRECRSSVPAAPPRTSHDYLDAYVSDLPAVVDLEAIRESKVRIGVDPLGGASVAYWDAIGERYGLNLEVVNHDDRSDLPLHDRRLGRPDPHGPFVALRHGAHGRPQGPIRRRLCQRHRCRSARNREPQPGTARARTTISPLRSHTCSRTARTGRRSVAVGKTVVSSSMIDRVAEKLGRRLVEVPVGFKWFVEGLIDGSIGFGGEESSGATFLRRDGTVWTTDKDGLVPNLLAAEITARTGKDPGEHYRALTAEFGTPYYTRIDAPATPEQKARLEKLRPTRSRRRASPGEPITAKLTRAPGNDAPIGGLKVVAAQRLVRGTALRHREHLQDLRGELQGSGPPGRDRERGPGDRERCTEVLDSAHQREAG